MSDFSLPWDYLGEQSGPLLVHSDAGVTHRLVGGLRGRQEILAEHTRLLAVLARSHPLWVPTFNYDFLRSGVYDPSVDRSQVGPISEYIRVQRASWRTPCPVFNFAGTGASPLAEGGPGGTIDPFDSSSAFGNLVRRRGTIVWYGAPFSSSTIIHHVERLAGGPPYRYDKMFDGFVLSADGTEYPLQLCYHVRPMGMRLEYDWRRLQLDLQQEGILLDVGPSAVVRFAGANRLVDFWLERLHADPLYLLDDGSRAWVDRKLNDVGRRFVLRDFEDVPE